MNASRLNGFELLRRRHQEGRCLVGTNDSRRMGLEGHDDRRRAALTRHAADAVEDLAVPPMHAVEVAQRQHRLHPPRGRASSGKWMTSIKAAHRRRGVRRQNQPIIGQLDAGRQRRAGGGVRQVVADVGEVGSRAPRRSTTASASETLKCVGCGLCRSASRITVCTPASNGQDDSGMALQSVR